MDEIEEALAAGALDAAKFAAAVLKKKLAAAHDVVDMNMDADDRNTVGDRRFDDAVKALSAASAAYAALASRKRS
jgi:hypothetical protein